MTRKQNRTCESCVFTYSTPQKLRTHYASTRNPCRPQDLPNQDPVPPPDPEIEYLDALGLFDSSEIGESSHSEANLSPEVEREYLEALGILEPISQFHQMDIISLG
ncbi:1626_t:CDS:1, partial [Diversispora eburnea]